MLLLNLNSLDARLLEVLERIFLRRMSVPFPWPRGGGVVVDGEHASGLRALAVLLVAVVVVFVL